MTHTGDAPPAQGRKGLPITTKLGFGVGDFAFNIVFQGTGLFLMYVYTDVFGLSPTIAGLLYAIALVWDAVADPIIGVLADRTRSRWGRYRPWLAVAALPMALSYALAFWNPGFTGLGLVAWVAFTHCFLRTAFAAANIPFSSLQARLSTDAKERTGLAGIRMMGAGIGGLSVALLTPALVAQFSGGGDEARGYFLAAIVAGIITLVLILYVVLVMREPADAEPAEAEPLLGDIGAFFQQLVRNAPLAQMFVALTLTSIAMTMFTKNILYYFKYVLQAPPGAERLALVLVPVCLIFVVPVWVLVANLTSKKTAWMIGSTIASIGFLALYFYPVRDPATTYLLTAVIAVGLSSMAVLAWSMLPDTVEWGEARLGVRHEAKTFGFAAFAQKASLGVSAFLLGLLLDAVSFTPNQHQSPEAQHGIIAIMSIVPLISVLGTMLVLAKYPIDAKCHDELKRAIAARRPA